MYQRSEIKSAKGHKKMDPHLLQHHNKMHKSHIRQNSSSKRSSAKAVKKSQYDKYQRQLDKDLERSKEKLAVCEAFNLISGFEMIDPIGQGYCTPKQLMN